MASPRDSGIVGKDWASENHETVNFTREYMWRAQVSGECSTQRFFYIKLSEWESIIIIPRFVISFS